jgi:hypothetical protein
VGGWAVLVQLLLSGVPVDLFDAAGVCLCSCSQQGFPAQFQGYLQRLWLKNAPLTSSLLDNCACVALAACNSSWLL